MAGRTVQDPFKNIDKVLEHIVRTQDAAGLSLRDIREILEMFCGKWLAADEFDSVPDLFGFIEEHRDEIDRVVDTALRRAGLGGAQ